MPRKPPEPPVRLQRIAFRQGVTAQRYYGAKQTADKQCPYKLGGSNDRERKAFFAGWLAAELHKKNPKLYPEPLTMPLWREPVKET